MSTDLTVCEWELTGWRPLAWKYGRSVETTFWLEPEIGPLVGRLPGSVQQNLLRAGLAADWNNGLNSLAVEWIEHRHWMFETELPERFPRCGGFIVWMGHDCFPCPANTSLIDFARRPKPAWASLRQVFAGA